MIIPHLPHPHRQLPFVLGALGGELGVTIEDVAEAAGVDPFVVDVYLAGGFTDKTPRCATKIARGLALLATEHDAA